MADLMVADEDIQMWHLWLQFFLQEQTRIGNFGARVDEKIKLLLFRLILSIVSQKHSAIYMCHVRHVRSWRCEAFLAISFHKNKMDEEAVDYFMKSLESKSKSLPDQILFDFLRCGMNALKNLKKKEELVQFQKIKFQFRNDLFSIQDSLEKTCKYYSFGTKASQIYSMWQNIWNKWCIEHSYHIF